MAIENAAQKRQADADAKAAADKATADKAAADKVNADAAAKNEAASTVDSGREAPSTDAVKQDRPEPKVDKNATPQSYVWLADGSVLRVNNEDLPGASGTANPYGHWQRGNKVYEIVSIHGVESEIEEN